MNILLSLVAVLLLGLLAFLGTEVAGLHILFGGVLPYLALAVFVGGVVYRVAFKWGRAPVPFRIPTTCGQQNTLPWIKSSYVDNPHTTLGVVLRMAIEVLFFRSLFRNTRAEVVGGAKTVAYGPNMWLWLAGLVFHWSMLVIVFRHLRFFMKEVPGVVLLVQQFDGFFQLGVPVFYATSVAFLGALTFLFLRRVVNPNLRYISLLNDYFPLFLILGIGTTGFILRHLVKTDIVGVKELTMGLVSFQPVVPEGIHYFFYVHLFLVTVLLAYLPYSKLMHMGGVFMSPTRNMANTNRAERHVNPWDYPVKLHSYEEYEDDYREKMKSVGIPVDKE
jgi:nitrate reductase gamma subunit